jgi:hypothetical protein
MTCWRATTTRKNAPFKSDKSCIQMRCKPHQRRHCTHRVPLTRASNCSRSRTPSATPTPLWRASPPRCAFDAAHAHADTLDSALYRSQDRALRAALVDDTAVFELAGLPLSSWPNGQRPLFAVGAEAAAAGDVAARVWPIGAPSAQSISMHSQMVPTQFQPQPPMLIPRAANSVASAPQQQPPQQLMQGKAQKRQTFYGYARPSATTSNTSSVSTATAPPILAPPSDLEGGGAAKLSRAQRQRIADAQVEAEERAQAAAAAAAARAAAQPPPPPVDSIKTAGDMFRADPKNRRVLHNSDGNGNGAADSTADAARKRKFQTPFRVDDANNGGGGGGGGGGTAKRAAGDDSSKRKPGDNPVLDALLAVHFFLLLLCSKRLDSRLPLLSVVG